MNLTNIFLLMSLAAIWGSSFIFMRATVESFGPVALIATRIIIASLCMSLFLFKEKYIKEFFQHWLILFMVGLCSSAIPFCLLAYASVSLSGGTVSILNAMTPVFTALIAYLFLNVQMTRMQFVGIFISIIGLLFLVWENISWSIDSWLPSLAGVAATLLYGIANNLSKTYLSDVSIFTSASGSLLFSGIIMTIALPFFMPDFTVITPIEWVYAITLGLVCTALAYVIHFKLIKNIGPTPTATVTFLIPIFSFIWGYFLLDEKVTLRMLIATAVILLGMALVIGILKLTNAKKTIN